MKTLVSLLLLFSISLTFGQETIYKEYSSEILNDTRDLSIYLPKGYNKDSISNFPLAIVLDGHKLFDLYVGASNYYAQLDHAPEQIVVGIDMKDSRNKDAGYDVNNGNLDNNSENFYRFIRDEMIPYIEATFKTSPFLTIVGESLTANYITHFLKEEYSIFNAYICLNPTLSNTINSQVESYRLKELSSEDNTFYFYLSSNPFSNVLMTDYDYNPDKKPAPPSFNQNVNEEILTSAKKMVQEINHDQPNIQDKLFRSLGEEMVFEQSLRPFHSTSSTTIPNDQQAFAEFCYGSMISCKEGNQFDCARNLSRHTN